MKLIKNLQESYLYFQSYLSSDGVWLPAHNPEENVLMDAEWQDRIDSIIAISPDMVMVFYKDGDRDLWAANYKF